MSQLQLFVPTAEKACSRCGIVQPLDAFHALHTTKDGRKSHCRTCERKSTLGRRRVIQNVAAELACTVCKSVKPQGEFQPSRITSCRSGMCKDCTKARDAQIIDRKKKQWQDRIDAGEVRHCKSCHNRKPIKSFGIDSLKCQACVNRNTNCKLKNRLRNASTRARDRGLSFDITLEEYASLVSAQCTYCGGELPKTGSGLDRIENDKGYSRFNCVPCCDACNTARGARWSVEQMVKFIGPAIRQAREFAGEIIRTPSNRKPVQPKPSDSQQEAWTAERFSSQFLTADPRPKASILIAAKAAGIGKGSARELLIAAEAAGLAFVWWPPRSHRIKHYANRPCDGRTGFCSAGPGEVGPPLERVEVA